MPEDPTASTPEAPKPPQPSPEAEPAATPAPEAPNAEPPKPEFDYKSAWIATQTTVRRLHDRSDQLVAQNAELRDSLSTVRETQMALAKQSLGEDEVRALEARQAQASERASAIRAAQNTQQFIEAQTGLFLDTLASAGINPADPEIDWARDSRDVQEWRERVGPSIKAKLEKAITQRITKAEEGIRSKSAVEIKAEAEALASRQLKAAGVDKVDSGTSAGGSKAVGDMNDDEFKAYSEQKRQEREQRRIRVLR